MPALANAKHESVAQLVSQGVSGTQAYLTVYNGTNANAANASAARLLATASVRARVQELQGKAAEQAVVTAADILRRAWQVANSDAKDRAQHLAIAARAFPEFRDGGTSEQGAKHLHLHGLTETDLRALASGFNT